MEHMQNRFNVTCKGPKVYNVTYSSEYLQPEITDCIRSSQETWPVTRHCQGQNWLLFYSYENP